MNTLQLEGWQLDYFTGLALGYEMLISNDGAGPTYLAHRTHAAYQPSENAEDVWPAFLRVAALLSSPDEAGVLAWRVRMWGSTIFVSDTNLHVAVCRALVLAVLGVAVNLPPSPVNTGGDSYENDSVVTDACEDLFA